MQSGVGRKHGGNCFDRSQVRKLGGNDVGSPSAFTGDENLWNPSRLM